MIAHQQIRKKRVLWNHVLPKVYPFKSGDFISVKLLDSFRWLELGLSQTLETQTLGQVQTPVESKTKLVPAAHLFLFCINVSEITSMVSEKISVSDERFYLNLPEGRKQSANHFSWTRVYSGQTSGGLSQPPLFLAQDNLFHFENFMSNLFWKHYLHAKYFTQPKKWWLVQRKCIELFSFFN